MIVKPMAFLGLVKVFLHESEQQDFFIDNAAQIINCLSMSRIQNERNAPEREFLQECKL